MIALVRADLGKLGAASEALGADVMCAAAVRARGCHPIEAMATKIQSNRLEAVKNEYLELLRHDSAARSAVLVPRLLDQSHPLAAFRLRKATPLVRSVSPLLIPTVGQPRALHSLAEALEHKERFEEREGLRTKPMETIEKMEEQYKIIHQIQAGVSLPKDSGPMLRELVFEPEGAELAVVSSFAIAATLLFYDQVICKWWRSSGKQSLDSLLEQSKSLARSSRTTLI
jgi:hypothetical protein